MPLVSAEGCLRLPVRLHGIQLAYPVDVFLDATCRRVLGFTVIGRDETLRFLPFAAAEVGADSVEVRSALVLLDDVDFYRERGCSLRSLLGRAVDVGLEVPATVLDVLLDGHGEVRRVLVDADGDELVLDATAIPDLSGRYGVRAG
ncbi:MAG TPA: hypothetical protein VGF23_11225 [Gaiellaceae bacterium]|jgi:hypothetical protein